MGFVQYIGSQFANPRGIGGKLSTFFMNHLNRIQYRKVIALFQERKPEKVLDIGYGNGYLLQELSKNSNANFYGIDISESMRMEATKRNAEKIENKTMELLVGDVADLKFDDNTFDFIYTVNTVYFWDDLQKGYEQIYRTLKEDGVFANLFYTKEWLDGITYTKYGFAKYHEKEIEEMVKTFGFQKVELIELKKNCAYCLLVWK